jgi:hypothetical protein
MHTYVQWPHYCTLIEQCASLRRFAYNCDIYSYIVNDVCIHVYIRHNCSAQLFGIIHTGESHLDLLHRSQVLSPLLVHCLRSDYYSPTKVVVMNSMNNSSMMASGSAGATVYSSSTDVCSGAAKALGNLSRRGHPGMING